MAKEHTSKPTRRQEAQNQRQRQQRLKMLLWGAAGLAAVLLIGWFAWQNSQQPTEIGEVIPVPSDYVNHIEADTPPGPYPSDPPAGGVHYPTELEAKFYEETDLTSLAPYPEGSLVHNLEHGYVIFWYNCAGLDSNACDALKNNIRGVMGEFDGLKLIAFPWSSLDTPLVMTSWGRLLRFDAFDADQARAFIRANRNKAPEPNAP
jgi:hypothetical protein